MTILIACQRKILNRLSAHNSDKSRYSCLQIRVAYTTKDSIFNDPWSRTIPLPDYSFENETEYGNIADTYEE
jgi:hypothetical protein